MFKEIYENIKTFREGDIMAILDIDEALENAFHLIKHPVSLALINKIKTGLSQISKISNQTALLQVLNKVLKFEEIPSEDKPDIKKFEKSQEKKLHSVMDNMDEIKKSDTEVVSYSDDFFDSLIDNKDILKTYYYEAKEHIQKIQLALIEYEKVPENLEYINTMFRGFHTIKGSAAFLGIKNIELLSHEFEGILSKVREKTMLFSEELSEVLFKGLDILKELIETLQITQFDREKIIEQYLCADIFPLKALISKINEKTTIKKIGQILIEMGKLDPLFIEPILMKQENEASKFGEIAARSSFVEEKDIHQAIAIQKENKTTSQNQDSFVKVSSQRLNYLVNYIGELVVNQSIMKEIGIIDTKKDKTFLSMENITSQIKNIVLAMGMVPLKDLFNKLKIVARNAAKCTGKMVQVETEGENTELDRNLVQTIYDPLVHIIRNAIDHGIELPDDRSKKGKDRAGIISLSAKQQGSRIIVTISDDGKGISPKNVIEKALLNKVISKEQAELIKNKNSEIFELLFLPGFSTKDTVTDMSGRGVGMDVVNNI